MINSPILIIGLIAIMIIFIELLFILRNSKQEHPLRSLMRKATVEENHALYNNIKTAELVGMNRATEILLKETKYWFGDLVEYPQFERGLLKDLKSQSWDSLHEKKCPRRQRR